MRRLLVCCALLGCFCLPGSVLAWTDILTRLDSEELLRSGLKTLMGQSSTCESLFRRGSKNLDKNPAEAASLFQRYESEGCTDEYAPRVNLLLGVQYLIARGVPRDVPQGVRRLTKAVKDEALHVRLRAYAATTLGLLYDDEILGYRDPKKAERWFKKAIKLGSNKAQLALGCLYDDEETPLYNQKKAEKHLVVAAESGDVDAQTYLGIFYSMLDPPQTDMQKAVKWLTLAGNADNAEAQFMLGSIYEDKTLPELYAPERAVRWYTMAVDNGYTDARLALGLMLAEGHGTAKNLEQAEQQFKAAAMEGSIDGVLHMFFLLDAGLEETDPDNPRMMADALKWMLLAERMDSRLVERLAEWSDEPQDAAKAMKEWQRVKEEFVNAIPPVMLEQVTREAAELYETICRNNTD